MIIHARYPDEKHPVNRSGSMLIEMTFALGLLVAIAYLLLQGTLNLLPPRQWVIMQNITDAHLTYEEACAKRISFDELTSATTDELASPTDPPKWPIFPYKQKVEKFEIGKSPGGTSIIGTVVRTRVVDGNNIAATSEAIAQALNPAKMETWKLQSHLTYRIGGKDYVKSRTVVRTR
jgi:hypothetical protein